MTAIKIRNNVSTIISGPSKFDLMLALFDRKYINTRRVEFRIGNREEQYAVVINSVTVEDGSGEGWLFEGSATRGPVQRTGDIPPPPRKVRGHYRTDTRKGHIEFVD